MTLVEMYDQHRALDLRDELAALAHEQGSK